MLESGKEVWCFDDSNEFIYVIVYDKMYIEDYDYYLGYYEDGV